MSYIQKSYKGTPVWVGLLVALVLLGRCVVAGDQAVQLSERLNSPEAIERGLLDDPTAAKVYAAMKVSHPEEFEALTRDISARVRSGQAEGEIKRGIITFISAAEARHRKEMDQAGPAAMAAYRKAEIDVIEALKKADPRYCATYVTTGQIFLPPGVNGPGPALTNLHVATWLAYADGRDHPVGRKVAPPTDADWLLIGQAMIANGGGDRQTIQNFFDPAKSAQLSPAVQCDTGLSFRRAIETLPEGKIDNFFIGLFNANPS